MLIRIYGELWNPDSVEWGRPGRNNYGSLLGTIEGNRRVVDFWEARGIYALYDEFRVIYIGQAFSQGIGKRLRDHLSDRLAGRWDMFSWYSTSSFRENQPRVPGGRKVSPKEVIDTLEALGIALTTAPLNRRYNQIPKAKRVNQARTPTPKTIRSYLEKILDKLDTN